MSANVPNTDEPGPSTFHNQYWHYMLSIDVRRLSPDEMNSVPSQNQQQLPRSLAVVPYSSKEGSTSARESPFVVVTVPTRPQPRALPGLPTDTHESLAETRRRRGVGRGRAGRPTRRRGRGTGRTYDPHITYLPPPMLDDTPATLAIFPACYPHCQITDTEFATLCNKLIEKIRETENTGVLEFSDYKLNAGVFEIGCMNRASGIWLCDVLPHVQVFSGKRLDVSRADRVQNAVVVSADIPRHYQLHPIEHILSDLLQHQRDGVWGVWRVVGSVRSISQMTVVFALDGKDMVQLKARNMTLNFNLGKITFKQVGAGECIPLTHDHA